jgi:hypothetical protein
MILVLAGLMHLQKSLLSEVTRRMLNCSGGTNLDHYSQGTVFLNSRDFNSAIFKFREAIGINPNHAPSHNNLGGDLRKSWPA